MGREIHGSGNLYHIFTKSIAGYIIFPHTVDYQRVIASLKYYQTFRKESFSNYLKVKKITIPEVSLIEKGEKTIVEIIGYCIMPTHIHLILEQLEENGISIFINNILNSYTRYFNLKMKRKGPLWEGRFKSVLVQTDEQLLHLTRYIHLNPVTAYIVDKPEKWKFSSYKEFIGERKIEEKICNFQKFIQINPVEYRRFVEEHIDFQREFAKIKKLALEDF